VRFRVGLAERVLGDPSLRPDSVGEAFGGDAFDRLGPGYRTF
jgi:hypothetical protein